MKYQWAVQDYEGFEIQRPLFLQQLKIICFQPANY